MASSDISVVGNDNSAEMPGQELKQVSSQEDEGQSGNERNRFSQEVHTEPSGETSNTSGSFCCSNIRTQISRHLLCILVSFILIILIVLIVLISFACICCKKYFSEHSPVPCRPSHPCPGKDWIFYLEKCYYFSEEESSWDSSKNFCSSQKGSLAKTENANIKEKAFVKRQIGKEAFWIGIRKEPGEGWKWLDGEKATLIVIGEGANCACLNDPKDMEASSSTCSIKHRWICTSEPFKNQC